MTGKSGVMEGDAKPAATASEAGGGGSSPWGSEVIDLRRDLSDDHAPLHRLTHVLPARTIRIGPGEVDFELIDLQGDCYGLMVLDGLLLAELHAGRAHTGWLFGAPDLIRPSGMQELVLTEHARWQALTPARIALLDQPFGLRAGGVPMVSRVLVTRATRTSNWVLAKSLVLSSPATEERLLLLFALLGERWGRVNSDGVVLTLPLTHAMLAAMCGVRRPSVTIALHSLERDGLVSCPAKGTWLLNRTTAGTGAVKRACAEEYERSLGLGWSSVA
jgi:CRP-like cAMP-binding protein